MHEFIVDINLQNLQFLAQGDPWEVPPNPKRLLLEPLEAWGLDDGKSRRFSKAVVQNHEALVG